MTQSLQLSQSKLPRVLIPPTPNIVKPMVKRNSSRNEPKLVYPMMNKEGIVADLTEISSKYDQKMSILPPLDQNTIADPNIVLKPFPTPQSNEFQQIFDMYIKAIEQVPNTGQPDIDQKIIDLHKNALNRIQDTYNIMGMLSVENAHRLFTAVEKLIFPFDYLPNLPKHIALDYAAPISNPNWNMLASAYRIYLSILNNNEKRPKLDFGYFKRIVKFTGTPDFNERVQLSHILKIYAENHVDEKEKILKCIESTLMGIREGVESPYCATPLCSFFSNLCLIRGIEPKDAYQCFINGVLPITTAYFYPTLHQFFLAWTSNLCRNNELFRKAMTNYLLRHWPLCTQKQWCFFELFDALIEMAPPEEADEMAPIMINKIEQGLLGSCAIWTNSCLNLLMRNPAPKWLLRHLPKHISKIIVAVRKVTTYHFDPRMVSNANSICREFYLMNRAGVVTASKVETDQYNSFLRKEKKSWESWITIIKKAERKDSTLKMLKKGEEVIAQFQKVKKGSQEFGISVVKSDPTLIHSMRKN